MEGLLEYVVKTQTQFGGRLDCMDYNQPFATKLLTRVASRIDPSTDFSDFQKILGEQAAMTGLQEKVKTVEAWAGGYFPDRGSLKV